MLDVSKAIQESDIPIKIIKTNDNFFAEAICFYSNKSLENGEFPNWLKAVNITLVFKKGARTSKINYSPVSILPVFSKIFEKLFSEQVKLEQAKAEFVDNILFKFQCGFRKGYGTPNIAYYWCLKFGKEILPITKEKRGFFLKLLGTQDSILGPLLFNIFLCDIFLILKKDILYCGYADDNTIFVRCYKSFRGDMSKPCKLVFK